MTEIYRFAGVNVQIESLLPDIHKLCEAYRSSGEPDITVASVQSDIDLERDRSEAEDVKEGRPVRRFSPGYLETLAVYRAIAEKMPYCDTVLFHGSCVAVDGEAYLFTAKSGTGKSTHARLWRELLGNKAVMVNDDKPLIRIDGSGRAVAFGTPWDGKHRLSSNIAVPLRAVCALERAADNSICEISKSDAMPVLLCQAYRPSDPLALSRTLSLIDRLGVRFYRLLCNMDVSAAQLSYETMKG